ncbi:uroporphyrinogen-III synthase [bacterium]|nr:uroporphyrinogen-III synthase [bacterium]
MEEKKFKSPAVAVIGNVVKEREKINWFETKPLFGKRIVVTRTREQAGGLSKRLGELGADVIELPTIRIEHPQDRQDFAESVAESHTYDWLVFTSPNGVEKFFDAFYATYQDARSLGGCRIAAIGPSTEAKIREYRFAVDLMPERFVAEGLLEAFKNESIEHQKILWVKAEETRDVIYDGLMDQGAIVDSCLAYRTVPETADPTGAARQLREEGADLITFTSGSTVENFFKMDLDWPEGCEAACIGPVTHKTFKSHCEAPSIESEKHDIDGLVHAILNHFGG